MHSVVAVALADVVVFDLSIPAQVFGHEDASDCYRFGVCTEHPGAVPSTTGFDIAVDAGLELLTQADTVIVPGFAPRVDPSEAVCDALRAAHARGARVASVCTGAFALASSGLFDGRRATTHWQHAAELQSRFPTIDVRPEVLYVDEGQVLSSAGIAAGIDLCLHMVRSDYGADLAAKTSRRMVAALYRSGGQAQFIERPVPDRHSQLSDTCSWALSELHRHLTVTELAAHAGYSVRSFSRQFQGQYGMSPARWLIEQRILEARRLLETTDVSIEQVAERCGLGTTASLRMHFARAVATTPTQYRRAFRGDRLAQPGNAASISARTPASSERENAPLFLSRAGSWKGSDGG